MVGIFFRKLKNRPSVKFALNLFHLKQSPAFNYDTTKDPSFFLKSKTLKVKTLNNKITFNFLQTLFYIACFITFLFVFII